MDTFASQLDLQRPKDITQQKCLHCRGNIFKSNKNFCCLGCELVYSSIHELGLSSFYDFKDRLTTQAEAPKNYAYLLDEAISSKITKLLDSGALSVSFYLPTIHCAACVWILERLPYVVDGILKSSVSFSSGKITLLIEPTILTVDKLASILHSIGYPPVPATDEAIDEEIKMERRRSLIRIGVSGACAVNTMMLADSLFQSFFTGMEDHFRFLFVWASALIALPAVTWASMPFYRSAIGSVITGRIHMDLPISLAIVISYFSDISTIIRGENTVYFDTITSLIFLLLTARFLQRQSLSSSRPTTSTYWDLYPSSVNLVTNDNSTSIPLNQLKVGDIFKVKPQERVPCDGKIIKGMSSVTNSFLTGESLPQSVVAGMDVLGGSLNLDGTLLVEATKIGSQTRLGQIFEKISHTQARTSEIEHRANVVSGYFTIGVLILAIASFCYWHVTLPDRALPVTIALLVVTCPCALGLAIPAATTIALRQAQKAGWYIRDPEALHSLARTKNFVFDKTGTITIGNPAVKYFYGNNEEFSVANALASSGPNHPIAIGISNFCSAYPFVTLDNVTHHPGLGVSGKYNDLHYSLGSFRWAIERRIQFSEEMVSFIEEKQNSGLMISVLEKEKRCVLVFACIDELNNGVKELLLRLRDQSNIYIASGDSSKIVKLIASEIGIPTQNAHGDLNPEEKSQLIQNLDGFTTFVGDGMNDAQALQAADTGIALNGGIEAVIETCDMYISKGGISAFIKIYEGACKLKNVITRNLIVSGVYNLIAAYLAVTDQISPLSAAILMPLSSFAVILSSAMPNYFKSES